MLILAMAGRQGPTAAELAGLPGGPDDKVVAALPGLGRLDLTAIEAEAVVVEFLTPPQGAAGLLGAIFARLPWLLREREGPLLLADARASLDADLLRARLRDGEARPRAIEPTYDGAGVLRGLLLGREMAMHPLACDAIAAIAARRPSDATLVRLLSAVLGARAEAAPEVAAGA